MKQLGLTLCLLMSLVSIAHSQSNPFIVGSGLSKTTQGSSLTGPPLYEESYFGFNGLRTSGGWTFDTDGVHNGGAIMTTDYAGVVRFLSIPSGSDGTKTQSITDSQILDYTRMVIAPGQNAGIQIYNAEATALYVVATQPFPYSYALNTKVSNPLTKGLAVQYDDGTNIVENFKVYGNGQVYAREINVLSGNFPDYVFKPDYKLMPLSSLQTYIAQNRHLPNLPTADEVEKQGLNVGATQVKLVEKIEELTLYILEQQKRIDALEKRLDGTSGMGEHQ